MQRTDFLVVDSFLMTLLEKFLPEYQFRNRHQIEIDAGCKTVYRCLLEVDLRESLLIRWLFRLRGISLQRITLANLEKMSFTLLEERPDQEIILGIVGQFWTARGHLQKLTPQAFQNFRNPGYAKAVWYFQVEALSARRSRLFTETRILCLDEISRKNFRRYWTFISPFSGWIRQAGLKLIKNRAEGEG